MKRGDVFTWYEEGGPTKTMLFIDNQTIIDCNSGFRYIESDIDDCEIDWDSININVFEGAK